jgi:hypothetical protein
MCKFKNKNKNLNFIIAIIFHLALQKLKFCAFDRQKIFLHSLKSKMPFVHTTPAFSAGCHLGVLVQLRSLSPQRASAKLQKGHEFTDRM